MNYKLKWKKGFKGEGAVTSLMAKDWTDDFIMRIKKRKEKEIVSIE